MTFHGDDPLLGPMLVSIKDVTTEDGIMKTHMILRLSVGTFQQFLEPTEDLDADNILTHVKHLCPNLTIDWLKPIISRRASNVIEDFDQKTSLNTKHYKFGVLCQNEGQFNEVDIFKNQVSSQRFQDFIDFLGERKPLHGYKGYSGGLDTKYNQTGTEAIFATYEECEIVFHVATLLPYCEGDDQQLARKRHIGNDIVAIVFQETCMPFSPDIISSQFLHAFVVVQPVKEDHLKISVVTKSDVADFGPNFSFHGIYQQNQLLREKLLAKLINAERACYKSRKFHSLASRTRYSMLSEVSSKLLDETNRYLKPAESRGNSVDENALSPKEKGIFFNMRSILRKKTRSKSLLPTLMLLGNDVKQITKQEEDFNSPNTPSSTISRLKDLSILNHPTVSGSETSSENCLNCDMSVEKVDKSLNGKVSPNPQSMGYIMELHKEIDQLQLDKESLLQNNVDNLQEIERLRRKQQELEKALELARKEMKLLRIGKHKIYENI